MPHSLGDVAFLFEEILFDTDKKEMYSEMVGIKVGGVL